MTEAATSTADTSQLYTLEQGRELRVEVKPDKAVFVKLQKGQAEIFGAELAEGQQVTIQGQKIAVFTWDGATVEVLSEGYPLSEATEVIYEAEETPMQSYLNLHHVLEARRQGAQATGGEGPRTMVVGPTDTGKTTLCKILLNYAVRMDYAPTFVDLDIGQGSITVPGCLAAMPVEVPVDPEEGLPTEVPLVYSFGALTPTNNPELYRFLVDRLANILDRRAQASAEVRAAGMIINTMGWVDGVGYELLLHSIQALKADSVLVVGDERLYSQLQRQLATNKEVSVVKLNRSGGVVARNPAVRKDARTDRVKEYFYGPRNELSPYLQTLRFDELQIYRVGGGPRAPTSALPIGATATADPLRVALITVTSDVLHSLLAVSHAQQPEQLLSVNVAGFLYVKDIDMTSRTITLLAPCPGPIPGKYLLTGSYKVFFD